LALSTNAPANLAVVPASIALLASSIIILDLSIKSLNISSLEFLQFSIFLLIFFSM